MPAPSHAELIQAMSPSKWDGANSVLYETCRNLPAHTDDREIIAKVLLIGRVYAAAIERRQDTNGESTEQFYFDTVAPTIRESNVDTWLHDARVAAPDTEEGLQTMILVHWKVTQLFNEISGLEKRSLASKYLHFHVPRLFHIFDARAVESIRRFSDILPRATRNSGIGDNEYRKFAEKCFSLTKHCRCEFGLHLSPRHIDNLLLGINDR